jgi:putative ABC transport system permease protein
MDTVLKDVRYAARVLRKHSAFTAAIVATLALGIGGSTAIFSLVNAALLRPLPFAASDRLAFLWGVAGPEREVRGASFPEVVDWRDRSRTLTGVAAYNETSLNLRTADEAQRVEAEMVSASYFPILGVGAQQGRTFLPEEDRTPDSHPVAVVSHAMWTSRFGSDPALVGKAITLNDRPYTVVGVMPEGFRGLSFDTDVWIPMMMISATDPVSQLERRGTRWLGAVARLKPGVTAADAQRDLDAVAARLARDYPESNTDRGVQLFSLHQFYLGDTESLLLALFAAVVLFLLIACANVASLQLVRATARRREMALRVAVGASGGRLVRQLLIEGLLLALVGGAAGLLLAVWGIDALLPLVPDGVLPRYVTVSLDAQVLAFSAGLALLCGLIAGLAPALRSSRLALTDALKEGSRSASGGIGTIRRLGPQQLLVVGEVALALVLLVGAGLMVRSLQRQLGIDPGFRAEGVLTARIALPVQRYDRAARGRFAEQLRERLGALPGVQAAAIGSDLPLGGESSAAVLAVEGARDEDVRYYRHQVSPDFFSTLGIRLVRGRPITDADRADAPPVAVVSEAMARRFWPDGDPVGKRFRVGSPDGDPITIVGVVANARFRDLTGNLLAPTAEPDVYFPLDQRPAADLHVAIRTAADPASLTAAVRREVTALDAGVPVYDLRPLAASLRQQTATGRFGSLVLTAFSTVALLLAAVGIYGMLAFVVGLSSREIAIRMALGATGGSVTALVVRQGMLLVVAGLLLGLAGAALATDALSSQLYGVTASDPATLAVVSLTLLATALVASYLPARRATRVDPQLALKSE